MATGSQEGFSMATVWSEVVIEASIVVSIPSFFHMVVCKRRICKAYLDSVQRFRHCPLDS